MSPLEDINLTCYLNSSVLPELFNDVRKYAENLSL